MPRCAFCDAPGAKQRCSRCISAVYCGRDCQKAHWSSGHKQECSLPSVAKASKYVLKHSDKGAVECAPTKYGTPVNVSSYVVGKDASGQDVRMAFACRPPTTTDAPLTGDAEKDAPGIVTQMSVSLRRLQRKDPNVALVFVLPAGYAELARQCAIAAEAQNIKAYEVYKAFDNMPIDVCKLLRAEFVVASMNTLGVVLTTEDTRPNVVSMHPYLNDPSAYVVSPKGFSGVQWELKSEDPAEKLAAFDALVKILSRPSSP